MNKINKMFYWNYFIYSYSNIISTFNILKIWTVKTSMEILKMFETKFNYIKGTSFILQPLTSILAPLTLLYSFDGEKVSFINLSSHRIIIKERDNLFILPVFFNRTLLSYIFYNKNKSRILSF